MNIIYLIEREGFARCPVVHELREDAAPVRREDGAGAVPVVPRRGLLAVHRAPQVLLDHVALFGYNEQR